MIHPGLIEASKMYCPKTKDIFWKYLNDGNYVITNYKCHTKDTSIVLIEQVMAKKKLIIRLLIMIKK